MSDTPYFVKLEEAIEISCRTTIKPEIEMMAAKKRISKTSNNNPKEVHIIKVEVR